MRTQYTGKDYKLFQNSETHYGLIADVNSKTKLKVIFLAPSYKTFETLFSYYHIWSFGKDSLNHEQK